MKDKDPRTPCGRETVEDGERFACPGVIEVRVPVYFDRAFTEPGGLKFLFTAVGGLGEDDTEGITMSCSECGKPAPRALYYDTKPLLENLEHRLREVLD